MRQGILFYSFIAIFVATTVVTLLGVVGAVRVGETQLNMLLSAFLVALAGVVVGKYRRTDFFTRTTAKLTTSLGSTIEAFDSISDEIEAALKNQPPNPDHLHSYLIRRAGDSVAAYQKMTVIKETDLEQLPKKERDLIGTYEKSMERMLKEWKKLKSAKPASQLDPKTREQRIALLREMKENLVGILNFLESKGIYLTDHYQDVRHLVSEL